jgi:hypothetical protein
MIHLTDPAAAVPAALPLAPAGGLTAQDVLDHAENPTGGYAVLARAGQDPFAPAEAPLELVDVVAALPEPAA